MFPRAGGVLAVTKPDDQSLFQREGGGGQGGDVSVPQFCPLGHFPLDLELRGDQFLAV